MNIKELFVEERAVSPVIGVILMVAITVILAAVIGTFVIGLGEGIGDTAPQASFDSEVDDSDDTVTFTHRSGDSIPDGTAYIVTSGGVTIDNDQDDDVTRESDNRASVGTELTAGSSVTVELSDNSGTVSLIYDDGDLSTTLEEVKED